MLVDELAHTNAQGCRHTKRYQDIKELLNAGIDVYTTVNVQHIESLCDVVASITEVFVRERIPDSLFDNADQVELVDIEPQELSLIHISTAGTLSTTNAMFVFLLIFIVLLVGALSFFPALALGPIAEFFQSIV